MLTTIALVIGALLLVLLAYASTRPDGFHIARTANIKAPADRIFPLINNLKALNTWNPFLKHDPNIQINYTGPEAGEGAAHEWTGNSNVGKGRIEITESIAPSRIKMRLDMLAPMAAQNTVVFTLVPKRFVHRRHVGHGRLQHFPLEADECVHQLRHNGRWRIREGPRRLEDSGRKIDDPSCRRTEQARKSS